MQAVKEIYLPDLTMVELQPFEDRVLDLVQLFHASPVARLHIVGVITAGEPIEALEQPEDLALPAPDATVRRHPAFHTLRRYLCPSLQSISADAFEIARVITPLLVGLKLSGRVDFDLNPWLVAGLVLMAERMGVAAFCAGDEPAEAPLVHEDAAPVVHEGSGRHGQGRPASGRPRRRRRQR